MLKNRNINIDLIKFIAVFSVISVHFFANTGFYDKNIVNINTYIMIFFRTLFMICVPLFMLTTGYLMKNKKISKDYYQGIIRVLITYFVAALIYLSYNCFYLKETIFSIKYVISSILNFEVGYSWYIEMYIGIFMIIPFLNLIYNNLETKKHKKLLILTMLLLTSFQGVFNIKYNLIPDWWINIYPITYYFLGCYLNEYKVNIKKGVNIILMIVVLIISTGTNILISNNDIFYRGIHNDWGSIFNVITSVLIFIFILNLNLKNINIKIKRIIVKISELSLGVYLTSSVVDNLIYFHVFEEYSLCNLKGYIILVPLVMTLSISLSIIINLIYKIINKYIISKIIKHIV